MKVHSEDNSYRISVDKRDRPSFKLVKRLLSKYYSNVIEPNNSTFMFCYALESKGVRSRLDFLGQLDINNRYDILPEKS